MSCTVHANTIEKTSFTGENKIQKGGRTEGIVYQETKYDARTSYISHCVRVYRELAKIAFLNQYPSQL